MATHAYSQVPSFPTGPFTPVALGRPVRSSGRLFWCSVDLRDGNQALVEPMGAERKRRMFDPSGEARLQGD